MMFDFDVINVKPYSNETSQFTIIVVTVALPFILTYLKDNKQVLRC